MKKYRPGMKADALGSGDTRCSGVQAQDVWSQGTG